MFVLVVCLCPSSVHVVATFSDTVLFPLICVSSLLPVRFGHEILANITIKPGSFITQTRNCLMFNSLTVYYTNLFLCTLHCRGPGSIPVRSMLDVC